MNLSRGSAARSALTLTGVNIVTQFIGFVYRIFLSRLIGAEGMGLYQLVFPVYSMTISLTASGLYVAVSRLSAEYLALGNPAAVKKLVRAAVCIFLALFVPVSAAIALGSDYIAADILGDVRLQAGLLLLIPCILLTGLENIHKNYFYGSKNVVPPAVSEVAEQLVRMGAVLSLLYFLRPGHGEAVVALIVFGMTVSETVSSSLLRLFYKINIRKKLDGLKLVRFRPDAPATGVLAGKMARIALPVLLTSLLGTLLGSANAVIIPKRLVVSGLDHEAALSSFGVLFGMTFQLVHLPFAFMGALSLVMMPRLAENNALKNTRAVVLHISKTLYATGLLVLPAAALFIPLGPDVSALLFDQPGAGAYFTLLTLDMAAGCYQQITGSILYSIGKQNGAAASFLLGGLAQLVITYYATAVPSLRLAGFIWAGIAGTCLTLSVNLIVLRRAAGYRPNPARLLLPALAALACFALTNLLYGVLPYSTGASAAVSALCGLLVYWAALRLLGVRPSASLPSRAKEGEAPRRRAGRL